jgi:CHAT domain-containing protein
MVPFGSHVARFRILMVLVGTVVATLANADPLLGQATPCCNPSPTSPSTPSAGSLYQNPTPNYSPNNYSPNTGFPTQTSATPANYMNQPNPNSPPSVDQTRWYVNNNPSLRNLDPGMKDAIIHSGPGSGLLNSYYLPNGQPNPFRSQPNWYLPTTWPSGGTSWQGVQPNGFRPNAGTVYNPSSVNTSNTNPNYRPYMLRTYRPSNPTPAQTAPSSTSRTTLSNSLPSFPSVTPHVAPPLGPSSHDLMKAIENREQALALSETASDKVGQIVDHAALAALFVQQGKPEQALMQISLAEPLVKAVDEPRLRAHLFQVKSSAFISSGEFEKAIEVNKEIMPTLRAIEDEDGQAEVFVSSGWAFQSLGNIQRAIGCYESAIYLFQNGKNEEGEVRARLGLASAYESIGEFINAVQQYRAVLPNASKEQQARMYASDAGILQELRKLDAAIDQYDIALSLVGSTHNLTLEGAILSGRGRAYMASELYILAEFDFEQAREKLRESGNRAGEAGVIANIGELKYWMAINSPTENPKSRFNEAVKDYQEALSVMRTVGDRLGEIGILTNTGLVYDAWGKSHEALPYYHEALRKMEALGTSARLEEFRISLAEQSANLYQRTILLEASRHNMQGAFELSERARARMFLDQLGNSRINLGRRTSQEFAQREESLRKENILVQRQLQQELANPGPEHNTDRIERLQTRLSVIRAAYEEAINAIKRSDPEYASFLSISPLSLSEVQRQLAPDVTVLSYYTTPRVTLAFMISKNDFHVSEISVTDGELHAAIETFRDFSGDDAALPSLKPLYKVLISPIKSHLKTPRLYIVPFGVLQDLPFGALTLDGKQYFGDSYAISYLPSVSVLPYIQARLKPAGDRTLVLANDQEVGFSHLNFAAEEARKVASLFGTQPLLGDAATTSVLRAQAGDYDILHLIAHFDLDTQNPQSSRIILGHGQDKDGPLELSQVFGLDLRKTNLVVLSGCQSQLGKRSRGDDIIGLSRAFIYAGSPSVIASLWSVDDEATQQLMVAFYTHLRQGQSKAEALRSAQLDIRRKYPNPYYWAGFVLTGDPG